MDHSQVAESVHKTEPHKGQTADISLGVADGDVERAADMAKARAFGEPYISLRSSMPSRHSSSK